MCNGLIYFIRKWVFTYNFEKDFEKRLENNDFIKSKRQHIVPASYLGSFSNCDSGQSKRLRDRSVFVMKKSDKEIRCSSASSIMIRNDIYTICHSEKGKVYAVEWLLSELERKFSDFIRFFENLNVSQYKSEHQKIKKMCSDFMAVQYLRQPDMLRHIENAQENFYKTYIVNEIRKEMPNVNISDEILSGAVIIDPQKKEEVKLIIFNLIECVSNVLFNKNWKLIISQLDGTEFMTSDNPVVKTYVRGAPPVNHSGLIDPNTIIIFPLSRKVLIRLEYNICTSAPNFSIQNVNAETVNDYNKCIYHSCKNEIIAANEEDLENFKKILNKDGL